MKKRSGYFFVFLLVVLAVTLAGCGGISQEQYDNLQNQLSQAQKDRDAAKAQVNTIQKELDDAESKLGSVQTDYNALKAQLDTAQKDIKDLQDESEGKSGVITQKIQEFNQLQSRLDTILDTQIIRYFRLNYQLRNYEWDLPISLRSYFSFKDRPRPSALVSMIYENDPAIDTLVRNIKDSTLINNLKKSEVVNVINKLVQSFPRTNTDVKTPFDDYPRYPLETLVEEAGDSQDTSLLVAAILYRLEYDVVLFRYNEPKHIAVGVYMPGTGGYSWEYKGKKYHYLETTGTTWVLGECPPHYVVTPDILPVGQ